MIIVDNNIFFKKELKKQVSTDKAILISTKSTLRDLSSDIVKKISDSGQIICINAEGAFAKQDILAQQGIDLLIWLRCAHKIGNPIVLYGFQSVEIMLRQKPQSLILLSEGTYYIRLPSSFSSIKNMNLTGVSNWSAIKPYLKSALNMDYFRHRFANKWGIIRLSLAYDILNKNIIDNDRQSVPQSLEEVIANFVYFRDKETPPNPRELGLYKRQINHYKKQLKEKKILYIDDQAKEGWADVLTKVLGLKTNQLIVISNSYEASFFKQIRDKISSEKPDCILLDLRLIPEIDDKVINEAKFIGAKLAKDIKKSYSSLPIIMFSASNKAENLRIALQTGCETLWTKEGIDDYKGMRNSVQKLFRLVKIVADACNKYSDENHRAIYESDTLISEIEKRAHAIKYKHLIDKGLDIGFFNEIDKVEVDTSFLMETTLHKAPYHNGNLFLLFYMYRHIFKKQIVILDDVLLEIIRHSKKIDFSSQDDKNVTEQTKYLLAKLYTWSEMGLIQFGKPDKENFAAKLRASSADTDDSTDDNQDESEHFIVQWINKILFRVNKDEEIKPSDPNISFTENEQFLHADETLAKVIPEQVSNNKSLLFLCDDFECSTNVGKAVIERLEEREVQFSVKAYHTDVRFPEVESPAEIIEKTNRKLIYKRMVSHKFNEIFDKVREEVLKIPYLE